MGRGKGGQGNELAGWGKGDEGRRRERGSKPYESSYFLPRTFSSSYRFKDRESKIKKRKSRKNNLFIFLFSSKPLGRPLVSGNCYLGGIFSLRSPTQRNSGNTLGATCTY